MARQYNPTEQIQQAMPWQQKQNDQIPTMHTVTNMMNVHEQQHMSHYMQQMPSAQNIQGY
jgi:hypothetical protein